MKSTESIICKPFVEISIISKQESPQNEREILMLLIERISSIEEISIEWFGSHENPSIKVTFPSYDYFHMFYRRDFKILERAAKILQSNMSKNRSILQSKEDMCKDNIFLILRYRTNFKKPMRESYRYKQWFSDKLGEKVWTEEIEDGFLHFYQTLNDFQRVILDLTEPSGIQEYICMKEGILDNKICQQLLTLVS
ncbi:hypothetical protein [Candidatus Lokiarchaeum ossiferum]|uniref:hypothetical protein n=1 Tax=Candidatus Lokiarchaeum ossiferum TaxID=2951803 RepID=UPI00352DFD1F